MSDDKTDGSPEVAVEKDAAPKEKRMPKKHGLGGMVKKAWKGKPMWHCPDCGGTTFEEGQAKVHKCPVPRYVEQGE